MEATDALVVKLDRIALFTPDGDWGFQVGVDVASIRPIEYAQRDSAISHSVQIASRPPQEALSLTCPVICLLSLITRPDAGSK